MRFRLLAVLVVFLLPAPAVSHKEPDFDTTAPYVLLSLDYRNMGKQLQDAFAGGYTVMFNSGWDLMLRKAEATEARHEYVFYWAPKAQNLQQALNEAAAKGYRLPPGVFFHSGGKVLLMELQKDPELSSPHEYLVLEAQSSTLQREVCNASGQGFRFVDSRGNTVIMEKSLGKTEEPQASGTGQPESAGSCRYLVLGARRGSTIQKELDDGAARGYRVVAGSATYGGSESLYLSQEMVFVMEKAPAGTSIYQPLYVEALSAGELEGKLRLAAALGFRAIGRTFALQGDSIPCVVMEKGAEPSPYYEYSVVASLWKKSTVRKKVTQAVQQGFYPVGMDFQTESMVLLERPRRNSP
jgi:hypothetical protein